jgi:DNA-binding beta-propeller fold protein YncE
MKTIDQYLKKVLWGLSFMSLLLLGFSCSPDSALEPDENLEAVNAKSNKSILKTLVKGANLKAANGLDIGPDGNLYVASVSGQDISVINKNSGKIIRRITGEPGNGVESPDDVVFNPEGTAMYWTDIIIGEVGRMDMATGAIIKKLIAPGVNPIRFSEDGRLFVALDFQGDGLYELNPDNLEVIRHIISCPEGFGLGFFNSFDTRMEMDPVTGEDKLMLYGPLFALNVVIAIDVDSFVGTTVFDENLGAFFGALGSGQIRIVAGSFPPPSDLFNPAAAKFGPDGMLYVLDQAGKFFRVNPDGMDDKTLISTLEPGLDNMSFDDDGSLYMTNNDEGWVAEILKNGKARILSPGGIIRPQGLVAMEGPNNQEVLFEADLFNLRKFNGTSGQQMEQFKGFLIPEGPEGDPTTLILPMNLSPDDGKIVVSSWFSGAVQVWDPADGSVENIGYGSDMIQRVPIDAVRVNGDIYIADLFLGGVVKEGEAIPAIPLIVASGLASDGQKLWVADWALGTITEFDFSGGTPSETRVFEGFSNPEGLALDHQGRLLVVETGTSILSRIDLATGDVTTLAEGLDISQGGLGEASPPTWFFDAVAVGPSGDIYITGGGSNVIQKIKANKVR